MSGRNKEKERTLSDKLFSGSENISFQDHTDWCDVDGPFHQFIQSLPEVFLKSLIFVDFVVRNPHDRQLYAATYFCDADLRGSYVAALEMLIKEEATVALHNVFINPNDMLEKTGYDWLYAAYDLHEETAAKSFVFDNESYGRIDLEELFKEKDQDLGEFIRKVNNSKEIDEVWEIYGKSIVSSLCKDRIGKIAIFGAPVSLLISEHAKSGKELNLGGVFAALSIDNLEGDSTPNAANPEKLAQHFLLRAILFGMRAFCAPPSLHSELLHQHQQLESMQAPLRELTRAFQEVQSKAQTLSAILVSPSESIFEYHYQLTPLFQNGNPVPLWEGASLQVMLRHSWSEIKDNNDLKNAQRALAYCIATVLVIGNYPNDLEEDKYTNWVLNATKLILNNPHNERKTLAEMVMMIILENPIKPREELAQISNNLECLLTGHFESDANYHAGKAMDRVKRIVHTPYKAGTASKLDLFALAFAACGERPEIFAELVNSNSLWDEYVNTYSVSLPFPPRAILQCVSLAARFLKPIEIDVDVNSNSTQKSISVSFVSNNGRGFFYNSNHDSWIHSLQDLRSAILSSAKYGTHNIVEGDFFGIFQAMQKLAPSLGVNSYGVNDWLVKPGDGTLNINKENTIGDANIVDYKEKTGSIFRIGSLTEVKEAKKKVETKIIFSWGAMQTNSKGKKQATSQSQQGNSNTNSGDGMNSDRYKILLIDHKFEEEITEEIKAPWNDAFNQKAGGCCVIELDFLSSDDEDTIKNLDWVWDAVVLHCNTSWRGRITDEIPKGIKVIHVSSQELDQKYPLRLNGSFSFYYDELMAKHLVFQILNYLRDEQEK